MEDDLERTDPLEGHKAGAEQSPHAESLGHDGETGEPGGGGVSLTHGGDWTTHWQALWGGRTLVDNVPQRTTRGDRT